MNTMFRMCGLVRSLYPKRVIIAYYFISTCFPLLLRHHLKTHNVNDFVKDLNDSLAAALIVISLFFMYKRIEEVASGESKFFYLLMGYTSAVLLISITILYTIFDLKGKKIYNSFMVLGYLVDYKKCISLLKSSEKEKDVVPGMSKLSPEISLNSIIICLFSLYGMQTTNAIIITFSWYLIVGIFANYIVWITLYPATLTLMLKSEYFAKNFTTKNKNFNNSPGGVFTLKLILIKFLLITYFIIYIYNETELSKIQFDVSELCIFITFILLSSLIIKVWTISNNNSKENKSSTVIENAAINKTENRNPKIYLQRKKYMENEEIAKAFINIPYTHYDYSKAYGVCCENIIGYIPIPVGIVGPLLINGNKYFVPLATTEGCVVAGASRGCRALLDQGVTSHVYTDGMTRGPVLRFENGKRAVEACSWIELNFDDISKHFDDTSRFIHLENIQPRIFGRLLFLRFKATTGDAMGMNMTSKATDTALKYITKNVPGCKIVSLSGNFCTDKKNGSINWILGRGKGVFAEAFIKGNIIREILKTTAKDLVEINIAKNYIGSAAAGCVGGFNAHASNIITAIFAATGQDIAQNIVSSNCMTIMELDGEEDLYVSCTLPSLEVGTVGGGTELGPQAACLQMMGVKGGNEECPGANSTKLAEIISSTVLAAELSLLAALVTGDLVESHLRLNRR